VKGEMDEITVDDAFRRIGQFGRIQKLYFVIIGTVSFITALHAFSTTFVDFTPSWSCLENGKGGDDTSTNWCPRLNDGSVHCAVQYGKDSPKTTVTEVCAIISIPDLLDVIIANYKEH
jgi:hypothetical protein